MSNNDLSKSIQVQRKKLAIYIESKMYQHARKIEEIWGNRNKLDQFLIEIFPEMKCVKFLYILDANGQQISSNIAKDKIIEDDYKRDRSNRPYMQQMTPGKQFLLSEAYISQRARRPSLTALHVVKNNDMLLGYFGADYDLRDLPLTREIYNEPKSWRQVKGDPAIRSAVFSQSRIESEMDRDIDNIIGVIYGLISDHGVFHAKLHFSSNRATIWLTSDPFKYRIMDIDMLRDPDTCFAYPHSPYPQDAAMPVKKVMEVLDGFKELRFMDETLYLRAGSINIYNGIVSLTFSCDGSHYIAYDEFLDREHSFWALSNKD